MDYCVDVRGDGLPKQLNCVWLETKVRAAIITVSDREEVGVH